MSNTLSLPTTKLDRILKTLTDLKKEVARLTEKVEELEPKIGSDEWWEWSDKKALQDIEKGRFTKIQSRSHLKQFLGSLKSA